MAKRLEDALGWRPVYWITQPELEHEVARLFPDVLLHDFTAGNRCEGDPIDRCSLAPVSSELIAQSGLHYLQGLQILSRHVLGKAISTEQMIEILNDRIDYCLRVVKTLNLSRFVLASTPHSLLDICFYVAFQLLGRGIRMHHLTGFRGLQVVLDDAEGLPMGLDHLDSISGEHLSVEGNIELTSLLDNTRDQTPWYVKQQDERTASQKRLYKAADKLLNSGHIRPGTISFDEPPLLPEAESATAVAKESIFEQLLQRLDRHYVENLFLHWFRFRYKATMPLHLK